MKKVGQKREKTVTGRKATSLSAGKAGYVSLRDQAQSSVTLRARVKKQISPSLHFDHPANNVMPFSEQCRSEINELWAENGADKIFRNREDFTIWLNTPNPGLTNIAPRQFLKSDIKKIADLLGRILYGVLA
jgi:hypothetical protein